MKFTVVILSLLISLTFTACKNNEPSASAQAKVEELYFEFSVDGKPFKFDSEDVSSSYHQYGANDIEFKIYAGKEDGIQLSLTIPQDMSKPSSTASGSAEPGNKIFHGSVSLQNYPEMGTTSNNYDGFINPKPEPKLDAVVITSSEKVEEVARIISGTFNTNVHDNNNSKDYTVIGKFRLRHEFNGEKF
jgi:hypothetical protein